MENKVRMVLADDHTILREGLRVLLSAVPNFEIVTEAKDGREAARCVEKLEPELLLMDLSIPRMSGMDAISEIKRRYPATKIIALTVHKTEEYLLTTLQAGADGYVLKDATHGELVMAIHNVKDYLKSKPNRISNAASGVFWLRLSRIIRSRHQISAPKFPAAENLYRLVQHRTSNSSKASKSA